MSIIKAKDKYNKLTAINFNHKDKWSKEYWVFHCDCGQEKIIRVSNVKNGHIKSCGCLYGKAKTHGKIKTRVYVSWVAMKQRCLNKNNIDYEDYGGRGITICPEWMKFENFYKDMGDRPKGKTLDRINNNKGYYKENCKWSTQKEQHNNKRSNRFLTHMKKTQTIAQWAKQLNMSYNIFYYKITHGQSIGQILNNSKLKGGNLNGK